MGKEQPNHIKLCVLVLYLKCSPIEARNFFIWNFIGILLLSIYWNKKVPTKITARMKMFSLQIIPWGDDWDWKTRAFYLLEEEAGSKQRDQEMQSGQRQIINSKLPRQRGQQKNWQRRDKALAVLNRDGRMWTYFCRAVRVYFQPAFAMLEVSMMEKKIAL